MRKWLIGLLMLIQFPIAAQTKEEIYEVFDSLNIHHQDIVYAQIILETGNLSSKSYKKTNNLLGLMKGKRLRRYNHWSESIEDYKKFIQSKYKGGDYYVFLKRIHYAENPYYINILKRIVDGKNCRTRKSSKRDK